MRVCLCNQKGGVAKTTSTVNLGVGLAQKGHRVLLIDADPQGSLTASLGFVEPDDIGITMGSIMMSIINEEDYKPKEGILHHMEGVDLLPANIELSALEITMGTVMSREAIPGWKQQTRILVHHAYGGGQHGYDKRKTDTERLL